MLAACSANPTTKTAKIDPELGVAASPRVVEDGASVPKGGGRRHVGKPYQIAGRTYVPNANPEGYRSEGLASWYGAAFHGRKTSNGEVFDKTSVTAAHPTMPLPSYARVTNKNNGRSIIVRVNDRGPFHRGRVIDVSQRAADALAFRNRGVANVQVEYIGPASLEGSDDDRLMATLALDGKPAQIGTTQAGTLMASVEPPASARPAAMSDRGQAGEAMRSSFAMAPTTLPAPAPAPRQAAIATAEPALSAPVMDSAALAALSGGDIGSEPDAGTTPAANAESRVAAGFAAFGEPAPLRPTISVANNQSQTLVAPTMGAMALSGWR